MKRAIFAYTLTSCLNSHAWEIATHYFEAPSQIRFNLRDGSIEKLAKNGNVDAQYVMSRLTTLSSAKWYKWIGKAICNGHNIAREMYLMVLPLNMENIDWRVLYQIGKYGKSTFQIIPRGVLYAHNFYKFQNDCARKSVFTWILCAKRLRVHKDIIGIIARRVWKCREK